MFRTNFTSVVLRLASGRSRPHRPHWTLVLCIGMLTQPAHAGVWCTVSDFAVKAFDHGGTYLEGKLNGVQVGFIAICGATSGQIDCSTRATDRRLAVALAAQAVGRNLEVYFSSLNACSEFAPYTSPSSIQMSN